MFEIPDHERLLIYGPRMINIQAEPVTYDEYDLLPVLREYLLFIMQRHNGVGIAAPQVGIFKNFVLMETPTGEIVDMVNPDVLQMYGHEREGFEACLSLPPVGNGCPVARLHNLKVEYATSEHPSIREVHDLSGMEAIVAQHELDHLTGTFFIDRAKEGRRKEVLKSFRQWQTQHTLNLVQQERHNAKNGARPLPFNCR